MKDKKTTGGKNSLANHTEMMMNFRFEKLEIELYVHKIILSIYRITQFVL